MLPVAQAWVPGAQWSGAMASAKPHDTSIFVATALSAWPSAGTSSTSSRLASLAAASTLLAPRVCTGFGVFPGGAGAHRHDILVHLHGAPMSQVRPLGPSHSRHGASGLGGTHAVRPQSQATWAPEAQAGPSAQHGCWRGPCPAARVLSPPAGQRALSLRSELDGDALNPDHMAWGKARV